MSGGVTSQKDIHVFPKATTAQKEKETITITNKGKEPTNSNFANVQN